jgi:hypothetical protein
MRLVQYKNKLVLTIKGWLLLILSGTLLMYFFLSNIHPFLAVTSPLKSADILVVEGWIPDYGVKKAIEEFKQGSYQKIITTGLPLELGFYLAEYKNFAELSAASFRALEFNPNQIIAVPAPKVNQNRTYACALALKSWIKQSELKIKTINLYTFGPHARRSWLIFKTALEPDIQVGIIAVTPQEYEPDKWWKSSEGVRTVIGEIIAYIYARFIDWES